MSDIFRVIFTPDDDPTVTSQRIEEFLRRDCGGAVLNNVLLKIRVIVRHSEFGLDIEPFFGTGSIRDCPPDSRKRAVFRSLLEALLVWGAGRYRAAALVFESHGRKGVPVLESSTRTFDEVMSANRAPVNQIVTISDFSRFREVKG